MTQTITPKQAELLAYLRECGEVGPSYDMIKQRLNLKAKSGVSRLMAGLVERGYVKKAKGRQRSYVVVAKAARSPWMPIETAPKDGVGILAWCISECTDSRCTYGPDGGGMLESGAYGLCLYHGHAEGLSVASPGLQIVQWGGGWSDGYEDGGGYMPDWWFRVGSDFEESANPTHWMPLPDAPHE